MHRLRSWIPTVLYASAPNLGPLSHSGYYIEAPAVGDWTLEVTDTGVSPPEGSV